MALVEYVANRRQMFNNYVQRLPGGNFLTYPIEFDDMLHENLMLNPSTFVTFTLCSNVSFGIATGHYSLAMTCLALLPITNAMWTVSRRRMEDSLELEAE